MFSGSDCCDVHVLTRNKLLPCILIHVYNYTLRPSSQYDTGVLHCIARVAKVLMEYVELISFLGCECSISSVQPIRLSKFWTSFLISNAHSVHDAHGSSITIIVNQALRNVLKLA